MPGLVPTPSLTLTITPPGGSPTDYTQYLTYSGSNQQATINQQFGRQGDTAVIPLVDDWQGKAHPTFAIPVLSQISLTDNGAGQNLFAGVVTNPTLRPTGPNINEWDLSCTDYTFYADNALIQGSYNGLTIDEIAILVTQQANCGITAVKASAGGFVAPAPAVAQVNFNWMKLSNAWRKLAQLASSSTPYGWYVDQGRNLHFFDATTAVSSGVTFRGDTPTAAATAGSYTEGHVTLDSTTYEVDGGSIRNRIIVQGANQTITTSVTGNPTDTWRADGTQTSWAMRYTVTGTPTLQVGGAYTSVTVVGAGGSAPASGWSVQQNAFGQFFLISTSTPSVGTVIRVWYSYQVPVIAQASDYPSQAAYTGPNAGVYTEFIQDTSLITTSMALARAQRERTEYAFAAERVTFASSEDFLGYLRAGETFVFTSPLINDPQAGYGPPGWGLTGTFLCVSNSVTLGGGSVGGYRRMTVTGVRI